MTKLNPEIENEILKAANAIINSPDWTDNIWVMNTIAKYLSPYLQMPIEDNLHDYLGKAFMILQSGKKQNEDDKQLLPHLEMWLDSNSINTDWTGVRDDPIEEQEPTEKLLAATSPENWDRWCEIYGYIKDGIVTVTRIEYIDLPEEEVKPPTKDTIEKIEKLWWITDWKTTILTGVESKINEIIDTVNHQQEQIQQLLSGK